MRPEGPPVHPRSHPPRLIRSRGRGSRQRPDRPRCRPWYILSSPETVENATKSAKSAALAMRVAIGSSTDRFEPHEPEHVGPRPLRIFARSSEGAFSNRGRNRRSIRSNGKQTVGRANIRCRIDHVSIACRGVEEMKREAFMRGRDADRLSVNRTVRLFRVHSSRGAKNCVQKC